MVRNNKRRRRSRNKRHDADDVDVTRSDKEDPLDEIEKVHETQKGTSKETRSSKPIARPPPVDSDDAESSSSSDNDSLVFEGIVEKERDLDNYESSDSGEEQDKKPLAKKGGKNAKIQKPGAQKEKKKLLKGPETSDDESDYNDDDELQVDFTFCDMNMDKHFHGIKTLLSFERLHVAHSSQLSDCILDNVEVGTLVTTEDDPDHNVYAFASVLNMGPEKENKSMYGSKPCISKLTKLCIDRCPSEYESQLTTLLSPKSQKNKAVGLLLQARMVNVPLTIVEVLHEQLIKDMDWAEAGGEKKKRRRLEFEFSTFLILAPCSRDQANHALYYKYVEDEIFASNAEFHFEIDLVLKAATTTQREIMSYNLCCVIVLTRKAYHASLKEFSNLVPPPSST